uniref:Uncharacterized protein n=1 Tax=Callorhinchus milii TaxID=7868 RepID=A0A4W3GJN5_CALMI
VSECERRGIALHVERKSSSKRVRSFSVTLSGVSSTSNTSSSTNTSSTRTTTTNSSSSSSSNTTNTNSSNTTNTNSNTTNSTSSSSTNTTNSTNTSSSSTNTSSTRTTTTNSSTNTSSTSSTNTSSSSSTGCGCCCSLSRPDLFMSHLYNLDSRCVSPCFPMFALETANFYEAGNPAGLSLVKPSRALCEEEGGGSLVELNPAAGGGVGTDHMYEEETAIDFSPYVVEPGPGAPLELYNDELLADLFSGKADKSQQPDYGFLQPGAG